MLSIDECIKILAENNEQFTDEEIKQLREFLYKIAKVVMDSCKIMTEGNYES